jgi:hypothetical protein
MAFPTTNVDTTSSGDTLAEAFALVNTHFNDATQHPTEIKMVERQGFGPNAFAAASFSGAWSSPWGRAARVDEIWIITDVPSTSGLVQIKIHKTNSTTTLPSPSSSTRAFPTTDTFASMGTGVTTGKKTAASGDTLPITVASGDRWQIETGTIGNAATMLSIVLVGVWT